MKWMVILSIAAGVVAISSCKYNTPQHTAHSTSASIETSTYRTRGVITAIDAAAQKLTVDHEEIPGYMEAMEMSISVAEPAMLDGVTVGDRVEIELSRNGSHLTVTELTRTGVDARVASAEIYRTNCAACHGASGEGADKGIPLTSGHALHHTEAEFIKTVTDGKGTGKSKEMPAFRDKLTAEQIAAVVRYVREDIQKGVEKKAGHGHSHKH